MQRTEHVLGLLDRHLTPIAIGSVLVGLTLMGIEAIPRFFADGEAIDSDAPVLISQESAATTIDDAAWGVGGLISRQPQAFTIIPERPRDAVITYTVQPGDTLFAIAHTFGIEPNTLLWANSETLLNNVHMVQPGIELFILPVNGVYHRSDGEHSLQWIADKYQVAVETIIDSEYNELEGYTPEDVPPWGMRIVVPGGISEAVDWRPPLVETVDQNTGSVSYAFMPGMGGSCRAGITGSGGSGVWTSPIAPGTYAFTQPFYYGHSGVDLAAPIGTPVLAADSGVVIFSGWVTDDWGYGVLVVLDHGNGWTTYYAHLSATLVSCGQFVSRGDVVGQVGTTGLSSGPHLHFEMRWGHEPDNPANYIGF